MQGTTHWESSHRSAAARPLGVPSFVVWLLIAVVLLLMSVPRLRAQDALANARSLYASAAYDEALKALQQLSSGDTQLAGSGYREVEEYRFLCLLALGRNSEARESISAVVTADPLYKLDENATSPRVLTAFRTVRREILPDILTNIYNAGKEFYDKKEWQRAETQFRKVIGLSGDPDLQGKGSDLVTLSKGFMEIAVTSLKAAETPTPTNAAATPGGAATVAGAATPAGAAVAPKRTEISATQPKAGEIVPPRIVKRSIPNVPTDLSRFGQLRPGELEILIDEKGRVQEARFTKPIHPVYDSLVIAATRSWLYEPARADGVPVKFRVNLKVTIAETGRQQ